MLACRAGVVRSRASGAVKLGEEDELRGSFSTKRTFSTSEPRSCPAKTHAGWGQRRAARGQARVGLGRTREGCACSGPGPVRACLRATAPLPTSGAARGPSWPPTQPRRLRHGLGHVAPCRQVTSFVSAKECQRNFGTRCAHTHFLSAKECQGIGDDPAKRGLPPDEGAHEDSGPRKKVVRAEHAVFEVEFTWPEFFKAFKGHGAPQQDIVTRIAQRFTDLSQQADFVFRPKEVLAPLLEDCKHYADLLYQKNSPSGKNATVNAYMIGLFGPRTTQLSTFGKQTFSIFGNMKMYGNQSFTSCPISHSTL